MKFFRKILAPVAVLCCTAILSSSCAFAEKFPDTEYATDIEVTYFDIDTTEDSGIMPYDTTHIHSSKPITGRNTYSAYITLTTEQLFAKAYYSNNTGETVTMWVSGVKSIEIPPYKGGQITWMKPINKDSCEYEVELHCSTKNLNGLFSLAKSDRVLK